MEAFFIVPMCGCEINGGGRAAHRGACAAGVTERHVGACTYHYYLACCGVEVEIEGLAQGSGPECWQEARVERGPADGA
jgi:hypothetical protein